MLTVSLVTLLPSQMPLAIPKLGTDRAPLKTPASAPGSSDVLASAPSKVYLKLIGTRINEPFHKHGL